jgi:hypothetical protein
MGGHMTKIRLIAAFVAMAYSLLPGVSLTQASAHMMMKHHHHHHHQMMAPAPASGCGGMIGETFGCMM